MYRIIFAIVWIPIICLCSCAKEKIKSEQELLGEWLLLDDPVKTKQFFLEKKGVVYFTELETEDLGFESTEKIPLNGKWNFSPEKNCIIFNFISNRKTYEFSGDLEIDKNGLEIRFGVGDPDDFVWKSFRLTHPSAHSN